jgi:hypothetical protein
MVRNKTTPPPPHHRQSIIIINQSTRRTTGKTSTILARRSRRKLRASETVFRFLAWRAPNLNGTRSGRIWVVGAHVATANSPTGRAAVVTSHARVGGSWVSVGRGKGWMRMKMRMRFGRGDGLVELIT